MKHSNGMTNFIITKKNWLSLCALLTISASILFFNISLLLQARNSLSWPFVEGEIISKECAFGDPGWHTEGLYYIPKVSYKYAVNGLLFYNKRLVHDYLSAFDCEKMRVLLKEKVRVYYDPKSPMISVLWPGPRYEHYAILFMWGVVTFISIFLWCVSILQEKKFSEAMKRRRG